MGVRVDAGSHAEEDGLSLASLFRQGGEVTQLREVVHEWFSSY